MNAYAEVIPLLNYTRHDWHAVVVEIARANPSAVVKAIRRLDAPPPVGEIPKEWTESWRAPVVSILKGPDDSTPGVYIQAIKYVREKTGLGLVEAKKIVDGMRAQLGVAA